MVIQSHTVFQKKSGTGRQSLEGTGVNCWDFVQAKGHLMGVEKACVSV